MAHQLRQFTVTVPTSATAANPQVTPMALDLWIPVSVEVEPPAESSGVVGYYLAASGQQYLPFTTGTTREWLIARSTPHKFTLDEYPTSGDWAFVAYNVGAFPHTVKVRWELNRVNRAEPHPLHIPAGGPLLDETPYVAAGDYTFGFVPPGVTPS